MPKERIQKVVAASGLYSRREVERLIDARKVRVNGKLVTQKGVAVDPACDKIHIDGKLFVHEPAGVTRAILMNKPRRVVVTRNDPEGRKTVYDLLPKEYASFKPVGRLDFNSQGALLLANDGDLILKLTHPRYHVPKVYEVKLSSHPDERQMERLAAGVILDGERTLPARVETVEKRAASTLLRITLEEGRNRQVRRMCEAVGLTVKELRRVAIGNLRLKGLRSGQFRELLPKEVKALLKARGR